jgi:hypothetical protein
MDDVARMPAAELRELFTEAANRYGSTPEVMEKDFWVTWTLKHVFDLGPSPAQRVPGNVAAWAWSGPRSFLKIPYFPILENELL